ncbi:MAG: hypothetical protein ACRDYX_15860 [Egibacteraceae bacterium]
MGGGRIEIAYALLTHARLRLRHRLGDTAGTATLATEARRLIDACPDCGTLAGLVARAERALGSRRGRSASWRRPRTRATAGAPSGHLPRHGPVPL